MREAIREVKLIDLGERDNYRPGDSVMLRSVPGMSGYLADKFMTNEMETDRLIKQALREHLASGGDLHRGREPGVSERIFTSMKSGRTIVSITL